LEAGSDPSFDLGNWRHCLHRLVGRLSTHCGHDGKRYHSGMSRILVWTETDIDGLAAGWGLSRILTEVDQQGSVTRELGYDSDGNLVHRHPGMTTRAKHGLFDVATIALTDQTDMSPEAFERLWSA
jgi:hypothetical protein